jgi:hypothetical protein
MDQFTLYYAVVALVATVSGYGMSRQRCPKSVAYIVLALAVGGYVRLASEVLGRAPIVLIYGDLVSAYFSTAFLVAAVAALLIRYRLERRVPGRAAENSSSSASPEESQQHGQSVRNEADTVRASTAEPRRTNEPWSMNGGQRIALLTGAAVILLMLIFPPFHFLYNGATINRGYAFLLNPPMLGKGGAATVDIFMLLTQWIAVLILTGLVYLALRRRP